MGASKSNLAKAPQSLRKNSRLTSLRYLFFLLSKTGVTSSNIFRRCKPAMWVSKSSTESGENQGKQEGACSELSFFIKNKTVMITTTAQHQACLHIVSWIQPGPGRHRSGPSPFGHTLVHSSLCFYTYLELNFFKS